jgi:chromosome segregation ATPase
MNPIRIKNINDITGMMIIDPVEYNRLIQENTELHNKIIQLTNESTKLNTDILEKNLEIEMLRKENQELREKIKILENKIANQDNEIIKQQKEIDDLKKENENRNNKDLLKKIIIGIQDLNALERLETKVSDPTELMNLHNDRIDECHYINSNYTQQEKDVRINILIDNINTIPNDVLNKFDMLYPNLLSVLKPHLIKKNINYNQRLIDRANNWWNL